MKEAIRILDTQIKYHDNRVKAWQGALSEIYLTEKNRLMLKEKVSKTNERLSKLKEAVQRLESDNDFYSDLMKLINAHCKRGLEKPDLVKKMKYATRSCELS
jgi:hypothetical protein